MTFKIGTTLTAIAGHNATGKSTVLGIIGNCFQIPVKSGKTILGKQFKTEFSQIINGSKQKDETGTIGHIEVSDLIELRSGVQNTAKLRVAWQTQKEHDRFRIIPRRFYEPGKSPNKNAYDDRKYNYPSFYLGLSRLFPAGEQEQDEIDKKRIGLSDEEFNWYQTTYNYILDLHENIQSIENFQSDMKHSVGITTGTYDYLCNSAGQDNLSQILIVLLSFKKLKTDSADNWDGGVFLIDELDATLHPSAQEKLVEVLYRESKEIQLQIIFTTHSLRILQQINKKHMKKHDCNILYLTNANGELQLLENPSFEMVENDMTLSSFYDDIDDKKIPIYSEDDEARWFLNNLIEPYLTRVRIINYSESCAKLLSLLENDPEYFKNVIFVLDGDILEDSSKQKFEELQRRHANLVKLPGDVRPESVFYDYLIQLPADHPLLKTNLDKGFTKRKIESEGPESQRYSETMEERKRYKRWFNDNLELFNSIRLFEYWKEDHPKEVEQFLNEFINKYSVVASRLHIPRIN